MIPKSARAAVLSGDNQIDLVELDLPATLPPGYALLRVEANGICGSDLELYNGTVAKLGMIKYPFVPGHEIVGTLAALTPEAAAMYELHVGDRVALGNTVRCGQCPMCSAGRSAECRRPFTYSTAPLGTDPENGLTGGLAEYIVVRPRSDLYRVSSELSVEDAVFFNPLANGIEWTCTAAKVGVGDRVLIFGAGQRGIACAIAAREAGAAQVIVTGLARDAHKLELVKEFGATDTINVEEHDLDEAVQKLTGGQPIDVVIDVVPHATNTFVDGIRLVRTGGTVVIGGIKGAPISQFDVDKIWQRSLIVRGVKGVSRWSTEQALRVIEEGNYPFHKLHTHTFGLDQTEYAIRLLSGEIEGENPIHVTVRPT